MNSKENPKYFKEYTSDYKGSAEWYCQKEICISCEYSYGPISFVPDRVLNLRCKRPTVDCEHKSLNKLEFKKIVDKKRVKSDNPLMVKYQFIVEDD